MVNHISMILMWELVLLLDQISPVTTGSTFIFLCWMACPCYASRTSCIVYMLLQEAGHATWSFLSYKHLSQMLIQQSWQTLNMVPLPVMLLAYPSYCRSVHPYIHWLFFFFHHSLKLALVQLRTIIFMNQNTLKMCHQWASLWCYMSQCEALTNLVTLHFQISQQSYWWRH